MRLACGAWPSSPRQAACRATPCPAEPRQRLRPWLSLPCRRRPSRPASASPLRPSWHTPAIRGLRLAAGYRVPACAARAPASACSKASQGASKLHNEELSAAWRLSGSRPDNFRYAKCRPIVTRPRPPWLSGCAGSHCVARFRLARLPPVRPRWWLPKSRRWRDGDLWISGLFSPSLHHECRTAGVCGHKTAKNQRMALSGCRICYLLLTLFAPFARLLALMKRGRQWHTFKSATTATAPPLTGC